MDKKLGMTAVGYAIVCVIILGIVMIISAPMMANKYKDKTQNTEQYNDDHASGETEAPAPADSGDNSSSYNDSNDKIYEELRNLENRMDSRMANLEQRQNSAPAPASVSDRYVCTIEGVMDENHNVVQIDKNTDIKNQKIIFACEYHR